MGASATLYAPAKLNLTLEVLAPRADGLHGLRSVMVPVDLCDTIALTPSAQASFSCDRSELLADNLVERALRAVGARAQYAVTLAKRIPTGAGMGGGSSDAAAILLAAAGGVLGEVPAHDYLALARSLGSDVPFFLVESAALVEGTGERVTALGAPPAWHAVVVKPPVFVSTAEAYRALDQSERATRARNLSVSLALGEALQRGSFDEVLARMQNDFHDVMIERHEEIRRAAAALQNAGAARAMLTGSGSCVFALVQTAGERDALAKRVDLPVDYERFTCALRRSDSWQNAA